MDSDCGDWRDLLAKAGPEDEESIEVARLCFVRSRFSSEVKEARVWIRKLRGLVDDVVTLLGAQGVLLPKEMRSFIEDPERHLVKKLFLYAHDVARGRIGLNEFERTATAAVRTSLRTNMRSVYEAWVLLATVKVLASHGADIVYPEHRFILLERTGRQRGGQIPPSLVLRLQGRGLLSFFLEAPRPISWGDSGDLARAWKLYVALRPDIMVYSGLVENIVRLDQDPPIARPRVIIEVKELEDWYLRSREVRGPFAHRMTAEEWRNRWIRGLWSGLAEVLGVSSPEAAYEEATKRKRGLRLTEQQIVKLYARLYKPDKLFLVSRMKVPDDVKAELEADNIHVVDDVGFEVRKLEPLAEELERYASFDGLELVPVYLRPAVLKALEPLAEELRVPLEKLAEEVLNIAASEKRIREVLRKKLLGNNS